MKITESEKRQLKDKISQSVSRHIRRRQYIKYGMALAAALVLGFFALNNFFHKDKNLSPIDNYVKSLNDHKVLKEVQLILGNNQNIEIADSDSNISYSNTGEEVQIGNTKSVNQKILKDQKTVFNTLIVPYGKRSSITLADGTKVWLNSGSKLIFPAAFTTK